MANMLSNSIAIIYQMPMGKITRQCPTKAESPTKGCIHEAISSVNSVTYGRLGILGIFRNF